MKTPTHVQTHSLGNAGAPDQHGSGDSESSASSPPARGAERQDEIENRLPTAARPRSQRSRVTNGRSLFAVGGDNRSAWARRLRDVFELHVSDLGGESMVTEAERSIVRRAATITVELERLEARFADGTAADGALDAYQRGANSLRRLLESVGLERRARDVTLPTLAEYLSAKNDDPPG